MQKVKIKILNAHTANDCQTDTLADCGFAAGDIVLAELLSDGDAVVESSDFDRALWEGFIYLDAEEFEVVNE